MSVYVWEEENMGHGQVNDGTSLEIIRSYKFVYL